MIDAMGGWPVAGELAQYALIDVIVQQPLLHDAAHLGAIGQRAFQHDQCIPQFYQLAQFQQAGIRCVSLGIGV